MSHHHSIHLGAAWEPPAPSVGGATEWTRRFGSPAGLGPGDRVLLVVVRAEVPCELVLNGVALPPLPAGAPRWTCDITSLLRARNELVVAVTVTGAGRPSPEAAGAPQLRGPLPAACGRVGIEIVPAVHPA